MDEFELSTAGRGRVLFHSREYSESRWLDAFSITLEAGASLSATVRVENPGYGHPPSQLFGEIGPLWKGWRETKSWLSLEGELQIDASSDSLGHVTLRFRIPAPSNVSHWAAELSLTVDAGALEDLAATARQFFEDK